MNRPASGEGGEQLRQIAKRLRALRERAEELFGPGSKLDPGHSTELLLALEEELHLVEHALAAHSERALGLERSRERASRHYVALFDGFPDPVFHTDPTGTILNANPAALGLLDADLDAAKRTSLLALVGREDDELVRVALRQVLRTRRYACRVRVPAAPLRDARYWLRGWAAGDPPIVLWTARPVSSDDVPFEDVMGEPLVGDQPGAGPEKMLGVLLGQVQALREGKSWGEEAGTACDVIEGAAVAQATLVNALVDACRLMTGDRELTMQPVDLGELITSAAAAAQPLAVERKVRIHTRIDPDAEVVGDRFRLFEVVMSLLSNAFRFTQPQGNVRLDASRSGGTVALAVLDDGEGIAKSELPHVFDRWDAIQPSASPAMAPQLGLGLSVARAVVRLHGGELRVQSDGEGLGSCFTVVLPALGG